MKKQGTLRVFKLSTIILMTVLCFACRKSPKAGGDGQLSTDDLADPPNATGAVNSQGLPYAGYNAGTEISVLKTQIESSEENKAFAQQIENAQIAQPKTLNPAVENQDNPQNLPPLELKVQWKGITTPLDFQGTMTLADGTYKSSMTEVSGQRPDLKMTAECSDIQCDHGNFFVFDPDNRKAGIVVTNENRDFKRKTLAAPINPVTADQVPSSIKDDIKVNVNSFQVIDGVSKFQIRDLDKDGKPADVMYQGELVEPNGECPDLEKTDKSLAGIDSLCLRGYTGDGDFLLKAKVHRPQTDAAAPPAPAAVNTTPVTPAAPPAAPAPAPQAKNTTPAAKPAPTKVAAPVKPPVAPAPAQQAKLASPASAPAPAPVTPATTSAGPADEYIYFESRRSDDTPAQAAQQQSQPPQGSCPVGAQSDNPIIGDILNDCNQPAVLDSINKFWGKNGTRNSSLLRFLNSADECKEDSRHCDSVNYKKMASILAKSNLPLVTAFISLHESGFTANAVGSLGDLGWWQFLKDTGATLSPPLKYPDDFVNVTKSTNAFVQYFNLALKDWDGDFKMALLYYNRGPGGANKAVEKVGISWKKNPNIPDDLKEDYSIYKNFWDIQKYCMTKKIYLDSDKKFRIDFNYVPEVLGAIFAGTAPEAYGISGYPGLEMK